MTEKRRMAFTSQLKTRAIEENNEAFIEGYFVVYNNETELWDGAFEEIQQGALDESIANNNIVALFFFIVFCIPKLKNYKAPYFFTKIMITHLKFIYNIFNK